MTGEKTRHREKAGNESQERKKQLESQEERRQ
jgi:hypothetical protein